MLVAVSLQNASGHEAVMTKARSPLWVSYSLPEYTLREIYVLLKCISLMT
jgi:hypothetical protein